MNNTIRMTTLAAVSLLAGTLAALAQGQTDSRGNAMGSERVGNGTPASPMTAPNTAGTTGSNIGPNGANHPTPSSTQGDVGPGGNNNGTRTR